MKKDIIERFIEVHGDSQDYSEVVYVKMKEKVIITCKKHNHTYNQTPDNHVRGKGCPICAVEKTASAKRKGMQHFLDKFKEVHGDIYTYSDFSNYKSNDDIITITCEKHREFPCSIANHTAGKGCPKCGREKVTEAVKFTKEEVQNSFFETHGDKYGYDKFLEYENIEQTIDIFCKEHNEYFPQTIASHKRGHGCPKCGMEKSNMHKSKSHEQYIKDIEERHGDLYDFSKVIYTRSDEKIDIICRKHGIFKQVAGDFRQGGGCKQCAIENSRSNTEEFIEKAIKIHGDAFDYNKVFYFNTITPVTITCKKHGDFEQLPNGHLNGNGCNKCSNGVSKAEQEIADYLKQFVNVEQSNKKELEGKELDIFIPELRLAIEFNGLYWHSDRFKDKNYHVNKLKMCKEKEIKLIQIFEDEWRHKKEIIKSRLLNLIGKNETKIFARKCEVREVNSKDSIKFLEDNHIQGGLGAKVRLGLYHNEELVSLMTFGGFRKSLGRDAKEGSFELLRFCNKLNTSVVGGASKLLKSFYKDNECNNLISYADLRWSEGNLYETLGFEKQRESEPNYFYTKGITREGRFKFKKDTLVKLGYDENKTEKQIMEELGYNRIYDAGAILFTKI